MNLQKQNNNKLLSSVKKQQTSQKKNYWIANTSEDCWCTQFACFAPGSFRRDWGLERFWLKDPFHSYSVRSRRSAGCKHTHTFQFLSVFTNHRKDRVNKQLRNLTIVPTRVCTIPIEIKVNDKMHQFKVCTSWHLYRDVT